MNIFEALLNQTKLPWHKISIGKIFWEYLSLFEHVWNYKNVKIIDHVWKNMSNRFFLTTNVIFNFDFICFNVKYCLFRMLIWYTCSIEIAPNWKNYKFVVISKWNVSLKLWNISISRVFISSLGDDWGQKTLWAFYYLFVCSDFTMNAFLNRILGFQMIPINEVRAILNNNNRAWNENNNKSTWTKNYRTFSKFSSTNCSFQIIGNWIYSEVL